MTTKPAHLEPSKLGTREYWDALYTTEIANHAHDPTDKGTVWFDDSDAETKMVDFLLHNSSETTGGKLGLDTTKTSFLDLGTGNGALLFALRDAGWEGAMLGVDYSARSVEFARRIERGRRVAEGEGETEKEKEGEEEGKEEKEGKIDIHFAEHDILHSSPAPLLDARFSPAITQGWDVLLDKGTFDAVSLSGETLSPSSSSSPRINEAYGARILPLMREGGIFLITSCNWIEAELEAWFVSSWQEIDESDDRARQYWGFETVGRIPYRSFSFGGVKGQTISTLCFRKVRRDRVVS